MDPQIEIQDWELLPSSTNPKTLTLETLDPEDGAINPNYFSPNPKAVLESEDVQSAYSSDSAPSWLDPDLDSVYRSNSRSFMSDGSEEVVNEKEEEEEEEEEKRIVGNEKGSLGSGEKAWWRVKFEILRVWVLRARPIWSFSIMAAVVGVLMVGRRLYRMKSKGRSVNMKIVLDDKKASQFLSRAARLNEAFSVMKRVPMVRPSFPPPGNVTSWPMMASLR